MSMQIAVLSRPTASLTMQPSTIEPHMGTYKSKLFEHGVVYGKRPAFEKELVAPHLWKCTATFDHLCVVEEAHKYKDAEYIACRGLCQELGLA